MALTWSFAYTKDNRIVTPNNVTHLDGPFFHELGGDVVELIHINSIIKTKHFRLLQEYSNIFKSYGLSTGETIIHKNTIYEYFIKKKINFLGSQINAQKAFICGKKTMPEWKQYMGDCTKIPDLIYIGDDDKLLCAIEIKVTHGKSREDVIEFERCGILVIEVERGKAELPKKITINAITFRSKFNEIEYDERVISNNIEQCKNIFEGSRRGFYKETSIDYRIAIDESKKRVRFIEEANQRERNLIEIIDREVSRSEEINNNLESEINRIKEELLGYEND